MSAGESFLDTLRTVSGMVDVVVTRTPFELSEDLMSASRCPLLNGGDGSNEHPSQALIDFSAIEAFAGPISDLTLCMSGDLTMRATTSLLALLGRRPPRELRLTSPESRRPGDHAVGERLATVTTWSGHPDLRGVDVLYLPGLPQSKGADVLEPPERATYAFSAAAAATLPPSAVILSPMPVIDEVHDEVRLDPRIRMFDASDRAVYVRMALLEWALDG